MKQTASEWLVNELANNGISHLDLAYEIIEKAKEMEKEQIIEANISGMKFISVDPNKYNADAEQYYEETYTQSSE